jgi:pimeloyl-ACP methyl ester carboxylesterase
VLLHAFPLSADQWLPQLSRVPAGWRLIAPDVRGFGGSDSGVAPGGVSIETYATDLIELVAHLDIATAVVGGLSMGGYIALAFARLAPERLDGIVLADTRAGADSAEARAGRDRMLALVDRDGPIGIASDMLPKLLGETTRQQQPDLREAVRRLIEANAPDGIRHAILAMKARPDSSTWLPSLGCPALVICGTEDTVTPPPESEAMARAIPHATLSYVPHAGHLSNLENAGEFTLALSNWLATLPAARPAGGRS